MTARLAELLDALDPHISRVEVVGTDKGTTARVSVFIDDTANATDLGALLAVEDPFGRPAHVLERALGEAAIWLGAKGAKLNLEPSRAPELASRVLALMISEGIVKRKDDDSLEVPIPTLTPRLRATIELLVALGAIESAELP